MCKFGDEDIHIAQQLFVKRSFLYLIRGAYNLTTFFLRQMAFSDVCACRGQSIDLCNNVSILSA